MPITARDDRNMKRLLILLMICTTTISCIALRNINTPPNGEIPKTNEQIRAEYHLMKNNLSLAMRENEVVKGENRICRTEIRQLKKEAKGLRADIVTLNQNYEQDMARMQEQYGTLEIQYKMLEEQSHAKIQELTGLNTQIRNQLAEETAAFNLALNKQKAEFREEREALKAGFSEKTKEYENRLNALTKELSEKEAELESLNTALTQAGSQIEGLKNTIAEAQIKMESMQKIIDEYRALVGNSSDKSEPAPETVQQAPKQ
ncbi:MAG: hypothetical protein C4522_05835 [Desulfobacteraceae bacterium]|nr:MAG: hypothetical protein C4522_05835 [Desulfobacteraceae bacterium]